MLNEVRLKKALDQYKQVFVSQHWADEKYKWEAVKWFQENWDVNAPDFADMLNRALDRTYNLLTSVNNFPKGMIVEFAKTAPEEVRAMFIDLFDEGKDVFERINAFKLQSSIIVTKNKTTYAEYSDKEKTTSDKVFLLSYEEVNEIFPYSSREKRDQEWKANYTAYGKIQGDKAMEELTGNKMTSGSGATWMWWLRTSEEEYVRTASSSIYSGTNLTMEDHTLVGVRPVISVSIEKAGELLKKNSSRIDYLPKY